MDNGGGIDGGGANLAQKFAALAVTSNSNDSPNPNNNHNDNDGLFQVMKAVEAAEVTIKQQADENTRLRTELQKKMQELEKFKSDNSTAQRPSLVDNWDNHAQRPLRAHQFDSSVVNQGDGVSGTGGIFLNNPSGAIVQKDIMRNNEDHDTQSHAESQSESSKINGNLKVLSGGQKPVDNVGFSQFSSPSTASFSPNRLQMEGECDPRFNLSGRGLMPIAEVNNTSLWKQDLFVSIREQEEEILQLRRHLADYSIKEAQIRNEKYVLEKHIAYMRMAFDQQQQDLVDAASKALSYRQDIIEENISLTYALQAAQQERSTFVSSLLPLLAEYSLQPPYHDAQSIVSNLKVLLKHLQEKLSITEAKLKESHYQLAPWRSDVNSNFPPQSPSHPVGVASNKNVLELVPRPAYSYGNVPITSSDPQTTADWDMLGHHQSGLGDGVAKNLEPDDIVRYSPHSSRHTASQDVRAQLSVSQGDSHPTRYGEETATKQVTFSDTVSSTEMDELDAEGQQNERDPSNWGSKNSPFSTSLDDPTSSYSPYLAPVLEGPSSSFSEAGDDDPLPAIEGLQISGDACPGHDLQACGFSINGTTSCNFEWVRHLEDGSFNYIEGAKQPNYLVTADDVDTYLAIEVQPLDNRKRKGELVKVFANEHRKISCDPDMLSCIEKTLYNGHASYRVSLSTGYLDIWEPATLAIKREGYSIKGSGPSGVVVTEKFSPTTSVTIPFAHPTEFCIISSGVEHILRAENSSTMTHSVQQNFLQSCSRDTIVLTLRFFIKRVSSRVTRGYGSIVAREWYAELPEAVRDWVDLAGFGPFCAGISRYPASRTLMGALVERWWDTTNSFHFSSAGDMTITPFDFAVLTGLDVGGWAIPYDEDMGQWEAAWIFLLGARPPVDRSSGRVRYTWFSSHFRHTEPETLEEITQYACGFLMFLFGTTLFSDRGNTVGLCLLGALADLTQVSRYDWGGASLATLYCYMSATSRGRGNIVGGYWRAWELWVFAYFPTLAPELEVEAPLVTPYSLVFEGQCRPRPRETLLYLQQYFDTVRSLEITWQPWLPLGRDLRFQFAGGWGSSRYRILFGRAWFLGERFLRQTMGFPEPSVPSVPPDGIRLADRLTSQGVIDARLGTDALLYIEDGEYVTYCHTYLMPPLTGVRTPSRKSTDTLSLSRARATGAPSISRAGTSRGGVGLVPLIPPTHHHAGWPDMPTELTGWRYGTSYTIPIEPPMPDHRYVIDPDSPPPPREYMEGVIGLVASLEGMVLRREAQLSVMGFQMAPVYPPQTGPSRPSRGAEPSRPSRGAGRGESSCRRRAHIVEEEPDEDEEEEEATDRHSETSADREEGSNPGSGSGEEAEEDPEDDSFDSDGTGGAEPVPQKRTKRASYFCS